MINEGLIYYGKFNDTVRDYSGNFNDPIPTDDLVSVSDKNGLSDNAYQFGANSGTTIKNFNITSSTIDLNNDFTYSCWIYSTNSTDSKWVISLENRGTPNFNGAWLQLNGNLLYARRNGSIGSQDTTTTITTNTWYHIIYRFIKSTNTTELWLNNTLIGSKSGENIISLNTERYLTIGNLITLNREFIGYIDEVRIYNRAITNDEITLLYNQYDFQPVLSNINILNNSGDIEIEVDAQHGLYKQDFSLEYTLNGIDWNTATLKYNPCIISDDNGYTNTILWDSSSDFTTNESSVQIRIQSNDTIYDSNVITSSTFTVSNAPVLPVEPTVSDLSKTGTEGDIEISLTVFDDYSLTIGEVEYQGADTNWYSCNLKYNTGKYFKASDTGENNIILWDSKADFTVDLTTKLRARVLDNDDVWSDYVESMSFTVFNQYNAPVIESISLNASSEDIEISFTLTEDKYSILQTEIQFLDDTEYFDCTIDYNPCLTTKGSSTGEINTLYWKSYEDIQEDVTTNLRIRVYDGQWSDWVYSSNFSLLNGSIPPEVFWYSPLKFKIDNEETLYFKIRKEQL